jgi:hypothetical protein
MTEVKLSFKTLIFTDTKLVGAKRGFTVSLGLHFDGQFAEGNDTVCCQCCGIAATEIGLYFSTIRCYGTSSEETSGVFIDVYQVLQ